MKKQTINIQPLACPSCNNFLLSIVGLWEEREILNKCSVCGGLSTISLDGVPTSTPIQDNNCKGSYLG